jgi:hypothetical protein
MISEPFNATPVNNHYYHYYHQYKLRHWEKIIITGPWSCGNAAWRATLQI